MEQAQPQLKYHIEGQGSEEFDLVALRNEARSGALTPDHQLMIVGTDLWKPASRSTLCSIAISVW